MKNNFVLKFKFLNLSFITLISLGLISCSVLTKKEKFSPIGSIYNDFLPPNMMTSKILENKSVEIKNLWAQLKVNATSSKFRGKKFINCTLLSEIPSKIRMRGHRIITSTLFEILLVGDKFSILFNKDNTLYQGTLNDLKNINERYIFYNLNPNEITRGLLIQNTVVENMRKGKFKFLAPLKNHYRLFRERNGEGYEVYAIRKFDLLTEEVGVYNKERKMFLRIRFKQYEKFSEQILPKKCEIEFLENGLKLQIEVEEYKINPEFSPEVFVIQTTKNTKVLPLKELFSQKERDITE